MKTFVLSLIASSTLAWKLSLNAPNKPSFDRDSYSSGLIGGSGASDKLKQSVSAPNKPSFNGFWGDSNPFSSGTSFNMGGPSKPSFGGFGGFGDFSSFGGNSSFFGESIANDVISEFSDDSFGHDSGYSPRGKDYGRSSSRYSSSRRSSSRRSPSRSYGDDFGIGYQKSKDRKHREHERNKRSYERENYGRSQPHQSSGGDKFDNNKFN